MRDLIKTLQSETILLPTHYSQSIQLLITFIIYVDTHIHRLHT